VCKKILIYFHLTRITSNLFCKRIVKKVSCCVTFFNKLVTVFFPYSPILFRYSQRISKRSSAVILPKSEIVLFSYLLQSYLLRFLKIDISALYICKNQLHAEPVTDVHTFKAAYKPSFNGRMQKTYPRAFIRCTGDDGIEFLSNL